MPRCRRSRTRLPLPKKPVNAGRWPRCCASRLSCLQAAGQATGEIEATLLRSLEIARGQQARSWELRTSCDLARLLRDQGRGTAALELMQSVYDQFTEGFETVDLREATALIRSGDELGRAAVSPRPRDRA